MNELDKNNLNDLDLNNSNPNQEVVGQQTTPQETPSDFREQFTLELPSGIKFSLGSCSLRVDSLVDIGMLIKADLEKSKKENGGTSYAG